MRIGVIQASSQKQKNGALYRCTQQAARSAGHETVNFGVLAEEDASYTYVETAFLTCLLLESKSVDFVVTGCSSGQGMMLACNSLPGVLCGYIPTPADAYLFGRINGGNAVSLPLGLNYGWAGELNLQYTLNALFEGTFGVGYPAGDAARKQQDATLLKQISGVSKRKLAEVLHELDTEFVKTCLRREPVYSFLVQNGSDTAVLETLRQLRGSD